MIRGTLQEFSLAEVIRLVSETRKTGALEISGPIGSGRIEFRDGAICGAESSLSREPLGRKLVRSGVLSESQLWNALSRQDKSARRLGETLVASGLAAPQEIDTALREQVEDSIVDVLRLEPTEFTWTADTPREDVIVLPAENLLKTLSEKMNELEAIRTRIPSEDSTVSMSPIPTVGTEEIRLTMDDWRVLVFLGARRSVRDLLHYSGSGETQMLRSLERLISTGLLEVAAPTAPRHSFSSSGRPRAVPPPPPPLSVFQEADVIRLPEGGSVSLVAHDIFRLAVVGSDPRGLCTEAATRFTRLTESAPVEVTSWSTSDEPAPGPARLLGRGQLQNADLVIGFDWSHVARATELGGARPEVTFTLLELWALSDPARRDGHEVPKQARTVVERAHGRRIPNARLLSTLEIREGGGIRTAGEQLGDVPERMASVLFGRS